MCIRDSAYGLDKGKEDELILVFDLGGGTFDVSLLEVGKDPDDGFATIQVKSTSRDNRLGGDDWDERIVKYLLTTVKNTTGMDLAKDKIAMQRLRDAAEQAKKELSTATSTNINLQYLLSLIHIFGVCHGVGARVGVDARTRVSGEDGRPRR